MRLGVVLLLCFAFGLSGCTPVVDIEGPPPPGATLIPDAVSINGHPRSLLRWDPAGTPRAVIVAVHGLKATGAAFAIPAREWAERGIRTYAWSLPLPDADVGELDAVVRWVGLRNANLPVYVVGESLGASLAVIALEHPFPYPVAGMVLASPAVWQDSATGSFLTDVLSLGGKLSDGMEFWAKVFALMERTREDAPRLAGHRVLVLMGDRDRVVPPGGILGLVETSGGAAQLIVKPGAGHTLLREEGCADIDDQVAAWMLAQPSKAASSAPSPSARDTASGASHASATVN